MKIQRLPKLARWFAGVYFVWSVFVYFWTIGSEAHTWWPIFLYFVIWPISYFFEALQSVCLDWLVPDARNAPNWVWYLNDGVMALLYIFGGTLWMWFFGKIISRAVTRLLPFRNQSTFK